jgi:small subunit ribosomal protein S21
MRSSLKGVPRHPGIFYPNFFYYLCHPEKKGGVCDPMIIVQIKENENIERALKKFKRKFEKTGVLRELRGRKVFEKKSVKRRDEIKRAAYRQRLQLEDE